MAQLKTILEENKTMDSKQTAAFLLDAEIKIEALSSRGLINEEDTYLIIANSLSATHRPQDIERVMEQYQNFLADPKNYKHMKAMQHSRGIVMSEVSAGVVGTIVRGDNKDRELAATVLDADMTAQTYQIIGKIDESQRYISMATEINKGQRKMDAERMKKQYESYLGDKNPSTYARRLAMGHAQNTRVGETR